MKCGPFANLLQFILQLESRLHENRAHFSIVYFATQCLTHSVLGQDENDEVTSSDRKERRGERGCAMKISSGLPCRHCGTVGDPS